MTKPLTYCSRDARVTCRNLASASNDTYTLFPEYREALRLIYQRVVENLSAWELSEFEPVFLSEKHTYVAWGRESEVQVQHWVYKNRLFDEHEGCDYTPEEWKLLVREEFDKERRLFEKLHAKFSRLPNSTKSRSKIPTEVRIFVWQRDGGRCVECSSNENLEYDHIIPFAKGGANTERNLQLLCGNCNRLKSDNIQ